MTALFISGGRRVGKSIAELWVYARRSGWAVRFTNGGHLRFSKPGRPIIHTSSTPSDRRAYLNALAMLRRADRQALEVQDA